MDPFEIYYVKDIYHLLSKEGPGGYVGDSWGHLEWFNSFKGVYVEINSKLPLNKG
jgi:hypothetical protein